MYISGDVPINAILSEIAAFELPTIRLKNRHKLPNVSAVYIAMKDDGEVLYIGKTEKLRDCWKRHEKLPELFSKGMIWLCWHEVEDTSKLSEIEQRFIAYFNPRLNIRRTLKNEYNQFPKAQESDVLDSLSFVVPHAMKVAFKAKCKANKTTMPEVLRQAITQYLATDTDESAHHR